MMIKKFCLAVLAALVVGLFVLPAGADDGYIWRNGFYWRGNLAYTRSRVAAPVTYYRAYNGYLYQHPISYSYQYQQVPVAVKKVAVNKVTFKDADWKIKLLELARQRDTYEGALRKAAFDQQAYIEAINALGLNGNFRWQNYGGYSVPKKLGLGGGYDYGDRYGERASAKLGSYGASGQTDYGYSVKTIQEMYGNTDMNVLYQQAARLTTSAQGLAGQANTGFQDLVAAAGENGARVAEIIARARAAEIALRATAPQAASRTVTTVTGGGTTTGGSTGTTPPPTPPGEALPAPRTATGDAKTASAEATEFLKVTGHPYCASCHSGKNIKGGFDIATYPAMTLDQKRVVWGRLLTTDPKKRMPLAADGTPGTPLPTEHLKNFLEN